MRPRLAAVLLLAACGSSTPVASAPVAPSRCDEHITHYRAVLGSAPGACTTESDCGIYGGFDPQTLCGGVTDAVTSQALHAISDAASAGGCGTPGYSCPSIAMRCTDGRCR